MSPSDPQDGGRSDAAADISCPRCGCRFAVDSVTVRVAGSDRTHDIDVGRADPTASLDRVVGEATRALVHEALRQADGRRPDAAEIAGIDYETFYELVRALDVQGRRDSDDSGG